MALAYVKARASLTRGCLDDLAARKLAGNATLQCRGYFVNGVEVFPQANPEVARTLARAADKLLGGSRSWCAGFRPALLDAERESALDLARRVLVAAGEGVNAMTHVSYGDEPPKLTGVGARCQRAVGAAGATYFRDVADAMLDCLADHGGEKDAAERCLGKLSDGIAPSSNDHGTAQALAKAKHELEETLDDGCGATLAPVHTYGRNPQEVAGCLACTGWRRAVDLVTTLYGAGRPVLRACTLHTCE